MIAYACMYTFLMIDDKCQSALASTSTWPIATNAALVWILIPFPAQPDKLITTCTEAKIWLASPEFFDSALDFTPIQLTALSTL